MEQAIFISKVKNLKYVTNKYSRVYYGVEFCERLIPGKEDLKQVLNFISKNELSFTLVTPYVTHEGLDRCKLLIRFLIDERPNSEIVINDWGFLRLLQKEYRNNSLKLVLGRLLTKQKRGPRILYLIHKIPNGAIEHFKMSSVDVPIFASFLMDKGINRVELDNLLQGISRPNSRIKGSLYIPFSFLTTTRLCPVSLAAKKGSPLRAILPCNRECQKFTFKLQHKRMPVDLFLKGNTVFFENNIVPKNLDKLNIDRLVYQPEIPL